MIEATNRKTACGQPVNSKRITGDRIAVANQQEAKICTPRVPKVEKVPVRAANVLPNGGDPSVRAADRTRRRVGFNASTIAGAATLGAPVTSNPLGQSGG